MKAFHSILATAAFAAVLGGQAVAQTVSPSVPPPTSAPPVFTKAPVLPSFQYPLANGGIFEIWTGGGGGPVNVNAPGVPSASITSTTAGIGLTGGWMFTPSRSPFSISVEGDISAQNFNGNNAGFSISGPLALEQRVMFFTSVANVQTIFSALPNLPNPFSQISAFSIPNGFTGTGKNLLGAGFFAREADISSAFQGVQSGHVWRANPGFVVMAVQPLTNGGAFREAVEFDFNNASKVFGQVPAGISTTTVGNGIRGRVGYAF